MNKWIQNVLLAFIMSCSMTALFSSTPYFWMKLNIFHIPIVFIVVFCLTIGIAEDVRNSFKKVFKFEKRKDKRPIWEVGVGMIFFFSQVGFVEVFGRHLMGYELGGMPLYFVFAFMNAFLLTVIYEELFYPKQSKIQG
ncbi:DNA polymerase I [Lysinibacillus halotolerans]|uniref:DNA polymerase I n=1 Tax=Lysinibacillus halotolerans TaxID=1368476 RepID=A0A3M8HDH4_9BACI|nr:DNA polymerase I [Lysinibacillus halotolerans]RND00516.1 DNA polymerase I [Lysinibacillus halotolerans]